MSTENRDIPVRDECRIEAKVRLRQDAPLMDCLVENISEQGAKLRIPLGVAPPSEFKLLLPLFKNCCDERTVQLRWQIGTAVGVRFSAGSKQSSDPS